MSKGNMLFVVCTPCEQAKEADFGVKIAVRSQRGWYQQMVPSKQLNAWFEKHSKCGGRTSPDHFQLAHAYERNHDQASLEASVKLAVVQ